MQPLTPDESVTAGDVLYHPAMGFAQVAQVHGDSYELSWETGSRRLPRRVSRAAALQAYQRCPGDGLFARGLKDPEGTRALLLKQPAQGAALLLQELGGPLSRSTAERWLNARRLMDPDHFDAWWADLQRAEHPALRVGEEQLALIGEDEDEDDDTLTLSEPGPPPDPWEGLGRVGGDELMALAEAMLAALSVHHLGGKGVGLKPRMITPLEEGGVSLRDIEVGDPADDLRASGWLLFERLLDRELPEQPHLLMRAIAGLVPPLPPAAIPLLEELVVPDEALIRIDTLAMTRDWSAARTHERLRALAPPRPGLPLEIGADSHIGRAKMRGNQTNQDAFMVLGDGRRGVLIVADGISICDTGSGDEASRVAVGALARALAPRRDSFDEDVEQRRARIGQALREANQAVCEATLAHCGGDISGRIPMGTTVVLAVFEGPVVDIASMGDSPAILVTPSGAAQLTPDHNVELERLRGARTSSGDSGAALTGFLGAFDHSGVPDALPFFHRRLRLLPGETLILCSDGVTDYAAPSDVQLHRLITELDDSCDSAQELASALVEAANQGGGGDNTTAIVARVLGDG
ncbi:MAG: serine/threonine-protein phosphatase [Alphaproteobacteria bacterium]|nr:serine/threonine-protein phosphatase [Alphaproteobacteria bacterium]MCB9795668.1 serine/threonine-protein phosphatase [Alphaproteobacteria bacterium]